MRTENLEDTQRAASVSTITMTIRVSAAAHAIGSPPGWVALL